MTSQTLAAHDDYLITLHRVADASTDKLVITFGGQPSKLTPAGFGTDWCLKKGWDTIYVAQRNGTQYQGLPLEAFHAALAATCESRDVVCYGSSLGGYAACYFGGSVNARIIAASPMLPAWPRLRRTPHMIPVEHRPISEAPRSEHDPVVIFDPRVGDDLAMVEEMIRPTYPGLKTIEVEHAGHMVLQMLALGGALSTVITPLIEESRIVNFDLKTDDNHIYHANKGGNLARKDPEQARIHLERSLELRPSRHLLGNLMGMHLRTRNFAAAQDLIDRVAESNDPKMIIPEKNLDRAKALGLNIRNLRTSAG